MRTLMNTVFILVGFVLVITIIACIASCSRSNDSILKVKENPSIVFFRKIGGVPYLRVARDQELPYYAPENRLKQIEEGLKIIREGMTKEEIINIMGEPDRVGSTIDKNNWKKIIGYSFVYYKQLLSEEGSANEKGRKYVAVYFNNNGIVRKIVDDL